MSAVPSEQTSSNVAEFFSPGPGERLRAARLSMGYDIRKIASELHLTVPVVESLEADDYEVVEARVFVRGYLRNYARIVGVPTDSILRQFDEKWPDDGGHRAVVKPSPRLPADGGPARGLLSIITWLIIIGLLVLFLMWWRGYLGGKDDVAVQVDEQAGIPAAQALPDDGRLVLPGPLIADGELRIPTPPRDPAPLTLDEVVRSPGPTLPEVADASTTTSRADPAIASPSDALSAPIDSVIDLASPDAGGGPPPPATTGQVVMTFTAPCWVDVRDSERQFKLFGEMPKGTQKVLGGTPPYKMVLGNARAVTITIDGVPYDLRPHAKGNVARFTLDP
jgi:cytoskeleton protein RodZ